MKRILVDLWNKVKGCCATRRKPIRPYEHFEHKRHPRDMVAKAVAEGRWRVLAHADPVCYADREIMKMAVKPSKGLATCYASKEIKNDRTIMKEAVTLLGVNLRYCSETLADDPEIVKIAVLNPGDEKSVLQHASERLRGDLDIAKYAVSQRGASLQHVEKSLKAHKELVLEAVAQDGMALEYARPLQDDPDVVLRAVSTNGDALKHASMRLRGDLKIAKAAIAQDWHCVQHIAPELNGHDEIVNAVFEASVEPPRAYGYRVMLLSGRSCVHFGDYKHKVDYMLRRAAWFFDMEPDYVCTKGHLLWGTREITTVTELEPGAITDVTLILT